MTRAADSVESGLARYRGRVGDALHHYFPEREPRKHLYDLVRTYPARGGKGLRPALCMATAGAFGANPERVLASAAAIEMFHNGFLIHDDIEDGSDLRRGCATLHREHGLALAVNAGDAVFALALRPILDNLRLLGPALTHTIAREFEHLVLECVEGQAIELGWIRDNACALKPADYLHMCLKKTCWYTAIHPCRIGALIGSGGGFAPGRLDRFGFFLGAAFQIQDDLLNLKEERGNYGKELAGDIFEGKRTLMLIHLLSTLPRRDRSWLKRFLAVPRAERTRGDVSRVLALMEEHGSIEFARRCSGFLAGAALSEFSRLFGGCPDTADRRFLNDLILYMIERDL
jgi:geranylgeranyl diphosphate synthase type II